MISSFSQGQKGLIYYYEVEYVSENDDSNGGFYFENVTAVHKYLAQGIRKIVFLAGKDTLRIRQTDFKNSINYTKYKNISFYVADILPDVPFPIERIDNTEFMDCDECIVIRYEADSYVSYGFYSSEFDEYDFRKFPYADFYFKRVNEYEHGTMVMNLINHEETEFSADFFGLEDIPVAFRAEDLEKESDEDFKANIELFRECFRNHVKPPNYFVDRFIRVALTLQIFVDTEGNVMHYELRPDFFRDLITMETIRNRRKTNRIFRRFEKRLSETIDNCLDGFFMGRAFTRIGPASYIVTYPMYFAI